MTSTQQHRARVVGYAGATGLALAVVFLLAVILIPSAHAQTYTVLHAFEGGDGANPQAGLIEDEAGNFYGTTSSGGEACYYGYYCGTVFKLDHNGVFTTLHVFTGPPADGVFPRSGLVLDAAGNLYGTTYQGGLYDVHGATGGTVFKLDPAGNETVLYNFTGEADGRWPGSLIQDAHGNLFGVTRNGGDPACDGWYGGCGTVFELDAAGNFTTLHTFTGNPDGGYPGGVLVLDAEGNLYGTTMNGGTYEAGTLFKLDPTGAVTILHNFTNRRDGGAPMGSLIRDAAGNFYGTTQQGGYRSRGTLYKLLADGSIVGLHVFQGSWSDEDGADPDAGVIRDQAGNLYGTTYRDGIFGEGMVFKVNVDTHEETVLHSFTGKGDGGHSYGELIHSGGSLYGTTNEGGDRTCNPPTGCGVVFKIKLR